MYFYLATFVVLTVSPSLINTYGTPVLFSIFSIIVFVGSVVLFFILPETKERTLQQVEDDLEN